ncbi:hypothetical protein GH714_036325 [Hevea brasiliensis]|uniref:SBP-type domain-containing protein n=1 Tax=Hevea brasiliensis TaxID=3981 RepID=A0A6A6KMC7_HEVBR|nr:hypothetical protein GH714_036325 [Hevea brasiliensis]
MEMGSGSLTESGTSNATCSPAESINGLKFGQKIYFENAGAKTPAKSAPGSSSSGSGAPSRKVHGGQQQQPPRCQVEGCKVDLSDAKAYYSRHKVCGMHSKSPKVIVAGLEQSFASSVVDNSSRAGGILVDFSAYSRLSGRDAWPPARSCERVPGNQTTAVGRSVPHPSWQNSSQNPPSNIYMQGSASGTGFSNSVIPSGECYTGVSIADSSCALSLLSNQQWGPRNQASGLGVKDMVNNPQGASMAQSTAPHCAIVNQYPNHTWCFKGSEASSSSHQMCHDLCLGQISQPLNSQFSGDLDLSQQNTKQYMELDHSRAYDSSAQHMHWSL